MHVIFFQWWILDTVPKKSHDGRDFDEVVSFSVSFPLLGKMVGSGYSSKRSCCGSSLLESGVILVLSSGPVADRKSVV